MHHSPAGLLTVLPATEWVTVDDRRRGCTGGLPNFTDTHRRSREPADWSPGSRCPASRCPLFLSPSSASITVSFVGCGQFQTLFVEVTAQNTRAWSRLFSTDDSRVVNGNSNGCQPEMGNLLSPSPGTSESRFHCLKRLLRVLCGQSFSVITVNCM